MCVSVCVLQGSSTEGCSNCSWELFIVETLVLNLHSCRRWLELAIRAQWRAYILLLGLQSQPVSQSALGVFCVSRFKRPASIPALHSYKQQWLKYHLALAADATIEVARPATCQIEERCDLIGWETLVVVPVLFSFFSGSLLLEGLNKTPAGTG